MKVTRTKSHFTYSESTYTLEVYNGGYMSIRHKCPASTPTDTCYDIILPDELRNNSCRYCDELDIPESLQALYYLYQYGRGV